MWFTEYIPQKIRDNRKTAGFDKWIIAGSDCYGTDIYDDKNKFPFRKGDGYRVKDIDLFRGKNNYYYYFSQSICKAGGQCSGVRPCLFVNNKFCDKKIDINNTEFTAKEKAQAVLDFFVKQNWKPIFTNEKDTQAFKDLVQRENLLKEYSSLETSLAKYAELNQTVTTIDFSKTLNDYDIDKIDKSLVLYSDSVVAWLDNILLKIEEFKKKENEILSGALDLNKKVAELADNYKDKKIEERNLFLNKELDFGFDALTRKILSFKDENLSLKKSLENADNFAQLAKIEKKEYPSFTLVAEHTGQLFNKQVLKLDWFRENRETVERIVELHEDWAKDYYLFHSSERSEFFKKCNDDAISDKLSHQWFEDWKKEREIIETKLMPLIEAGLNEMVSFEILNQVVEKLGNYKEDLKDFYMDFRIGNYIKFEDKDDDGFSDIIGSEKEMGNVSEKFHLDLEELIFLPEKTEARLFIARWSQGWFDIRIGELITISEKDTWAEKIAKETLEEFRDLQKSNFEAMIQDKEAYVEAREKKYTKMRSLMRKMSKELEK